MNNIGNLYKNGGHGVTKNLATAGSWYRKSAEAGEEVGQHNLGDCYYDGDGVTKNLGTARSWFQKAADRGNLDSMRKLGCMMVKGEGGAKDIEGGIAMWRQAAEKNDDEAKENLDKLDELISGASFSF